MTAENQQHPADAEGEAAPDWFCLRSRTKQEHLAAMHIRSRVGIEVFAPRISFSKKTRSGKKRFTEAMFPGYLFCYCNIQEHLRHLLAIQGVIGIVRYGSRIPPVPAAFIEDLRSRIPGEMFEKPDPVIEIGSEVTVVEGPFKDLQAVVSQVLAARDRVRILLEFLGRQAEVEIPLQAVFKEDRSPKKNP